MSDEKKDSPRPQPKQLAVFKHDRQILCARFSADGQVLAGGGMEGVIHCWKAGEKELTSARQFNGHHAWVSTLTFHPSLTVLFSADSWGQLRCNQLENNDSKSEYRAKLLWKNATAHDGWIRQLAVSADGKHLASCGRDQFVRVWTTEGNLVAERKHADDVYAVAFAPDGTTLAFGDLKGRIQAWDFLARKVIHEFDGAAFYKCDRIQDIGGLRALAFLKDGQTLVAAGTKPENGATVQSIPTILFFEATTGQLKQRFTVGGLNDGFIHDLAVHPEGFVMAVTSGAPGSGLVLLLEPAKTEAFYKSTEIPNCHALALHPDGKRFVVTATNRESNGNGRRLNKQGEYAGNTSPIHLFELQD